MAHISPSRGLLSPVSSVASPSSPSPRTNQVLPAARSSPLKPGSRKEIALINYVDDKILRITRRYGKKFSNDASHQDDAPGYTDFNQVVRDLHAAFQVVWISGTPAVQVPYLLSIAGIFCSYMPAFPFSTSTFPLAQKLDAAFAQLLQSPMAGSTGSSSDAATYHLSITDKVRIKSLIEETRVVAVQTATNSGHQPRVEEITSSDDDDDDSYDLVEDDGQKEISNDVISINIAKIYRQTMEILGDSLV